MSEWIVVQPHIVGTAADWHLSIESDRVRLPTWGNAVKHGLDATGHDDWWIAKVEGNRLVGLQWMAEEQREEEECSAVAQALGLDYDPAPRA